jgi:lysozyme
MSTTPDLLRPILYLCGKEGLVLEWYLDTEKVGTWALGVTDKSGHLVGRYKDNPSTIERAVEVSVWLMKQKYLPTVVKAFAGHTLLEHELAAALSFHYNTGAIATTSWVKMFLKGDRKGAREFLETHYTNDTTNDGKNNGVLSTRRADEADLFFDAEWPADLGKVTVFQVSKPRYTPFRGRSMDITAQVKHALLA